jgi:hypothetical protein
MDSTERPIEPPDARTAPRPTWLTYAQAGERLGLTPEAVRHRARRSGWRTIPGNDGRTLVMVPDGIEAQSMRTDVRTPDRTPDQAEEAARANARAEQADADRRMAEQRADAAVRLANQTLDHLARAEQAIQAERSRADALRDQFETLRSQLAQVEAEGAASDIQAAELTAQLKQARTDAQELGQADAARKARGRLRRAWDGWRRR